MSDVLGLPSALFEELVGVGEQAVPKAAQQDDVDERSFDVVVNVCRDQGVDPGRYTREAMMAAAPIDAAEARMLAALLVLAVAATRNLRFNKGLIFHHVHPFYGISEDLYREMVGCGKAAIRKVIREYRKDPQFGEAQQFLDEIS